MKKNAAKTPKAKAPDKDGATGTYVYDPALKKVVKVSSDIPSVASKASGGGGPASDVSSCGGTCGTGSCPMGGDF